ncbi:uncharacterized protein [Diadema antillarum]|uniref:uncharacterized protein n=1 Tax=Diadema antillarum TaxID=105358 RepID=UPI003A877F26
MGKVKQAFTKVTLQLSGESTGLDGDKVVLTETNCMQCNENNSNCNCKELAKTKPENSLDAQSGESTGKPTPDDRDDLTDPDRTNPERDSKEEEQEERSGPMRPGRTKHVRFHSDVRGGDDDDDGGSLRRGRRPDTRRMTLCKRIRLFLRRQLGRLFSFLGKGALVAPPPPGYPYVPVKTNSATRSLNTDDEYDGVSYGMFLF